MDLPLRYIWGGALTSIVVLAAIVISIPSTDDFSPDNPLWNGMSVIASRLNASTIPLIGVKSILPRSSAVLVIGPDRDFTPEEIEAVLSYLSNGGILVVADDFGTGGELLKGIGVGVRFNGSLLADPLFKYRAQYLPRIEAEVRGMRYSIYFNYGTVLDIEEGGGTCIAYSSPFSYLDINLNGKRDEGEPYGPFCTAYMVRFGSGVAYIVSDSSIFINSMVGVGDNLGFIAAIVGNRSTFIVSDKWVQGVYSAVRSYLLGIAHLLFSTSYKYPSAAILGIISYTLGRYLYRLIEYRRRKPRMSGAGEEVRDVVSKHPEWDQRVLERIAREVMGDG